MVAGVSAALAQGTVNFATGNANTARGNVFLNNGTTPAPSTYLGEVWWSTSATGTYALVPSNTLGYAGATAFNSSVPGTISDGTLFWATTEAGSTVYLQLRVWNGTPTTFNGVGTVGGLTTATPTLSGPYAAGVAQWGYSAPVSRVLGGTDTEGNIFTPPTFNTFANFTLTAVPEPGVIALAGLGLASLVIFRRRK